MNFAFFRIVLLSTSTMLYWGTYGYAAQPLAQIETATQSASDAGLTPELREMINAVLGDVDAAPRSTAQARRRANTAAEQTLSVLRANGYYGAQVTARITGMSDQSDKPNSKAQMNTGLTPILTITPGPQFRFGDITINYDGDTPNINDGVKAAVGLQSGTPALAEQVLAAELRAIDRLKSKGYPDAAARPRKVVVDHDSATMTVTFNFFTGQKTRFGTIEQTGDAYLVQSWPAMIAPFETGDVFDHKAMNRLASRVIGTAVFDGATATLLDEKTPNDDGTVTRNVALNIQQGNINTVSGELGYSTTDGSGVDLVYERRNFIGYAQTLKLLGTAKTNEISAGIAYNIPFAWRADRELDFAATVAREDTDAFTGERASVSGLLTQKFAPFIKVSGGLSLEASQFTENNQEVRAYIVEGLLKAQYDNRDSLFDPQKGVNIEADITPSYNFGGAEGFFTNAEIGASTYRRISPEIIAAGRVKLGTIFGASQASVPLNRRYYAGGGGSVRGFGYQSISPLNDDGELIGGRSITEASAELRYQRDNSNLGFVGFVDAGSVTRPDLPTLGDVRYGAGVGVRYYTSFAPLRADIAVPINKRDGDNAVQIYISIGQAF